MGRCSLSLAITALLLVGTLSCDRGDANLPAESAERERQLVAPPPMPPEYSFAPGLREQYRDVADFVQQFLETCLAGDYAEYRQLVSRNRNPESKERFEAIYHAIRQVTVESIEPVELPDVPGPAYLVISAVDFHPDARVRLRERARQIAMLVFQEDGQWRMAPAPSEFQPESETAATASAPVTSAPDYPWDADGDY